MRIVAGKFRGTNLYVPDNPATRPTMDRTRQAVFNILRSAAWALKPDGSPLLHGALVLDVFAGSGAIGFEALSQGAAAAVFFEQQAQALQAIEKNSLKLRVGDVVKLIKGDVLKPPVNHGPPARIAFFDPPYHETLLVPSIESLRGKKWLDHTTLLVMEMHKQEELATDLTLFDARIYGLSKIVFARLN